MNATCESSITGRRRASLSPEGAASQHFLHCGSRTGRCNPVRIPANNSHCFAPFRADSHPFAPENFLCAFNQPWLPWSKRPLSVHYTKPNISERKGWGGKIRTLQTSNLRRRFPNGRWVLSRRSLHPSELGPLYQPASYGHPLFLLECPPPPGVRFVGS